SCSIRLSVSLATRSGNTLSTASASAPEPGTRLLWHRSCPAPGRIDFFYLRYVTNVSILSVSTCFHTQRLCPTGGSYGAAWRGGIPDLHQCIPRTPNALSPTRYRSRLGTLRGL